MNYQVVEKFVSINGEGRKAGQLAVFIRFRGCNLNCSYCDTRWANEKDAAAESMTEQEICDYIKAQNVQNVTLTGGEPLAQPGIFGLLELLAKENLQVEIETNGSVDIRPFQNMKNPPSFTVDYKLEGSGMSTQMCRENFQSVTPRDTVKFVAGSIGDLEQAEQIMNEYGLTGKCSIYLSPVFGKINPQDMVAFMIEHHMNQVNLQLQMHKFIWAPDKRGV